MEEDGALITERVGQKLILSLLLRCSYAKIIMHYYAERIAKISMLLPIQSKEKRALPAE